MQVGQPPPDIGELPGQKGGFCRVIIPYHSPGIWNIPVSKSFLRYDLPRLQLQLSVIFLLTQGLYLLLRRFRLQRIVPEILAGIILGPSVMGRIIPKFTETMFPTEGEVFIDTLSKVGYVFFMFIAGVQMQPSRIIKSGKSVWTIGLASVVISLAGGYGMMKLFEFYLPKYRHPASRAIIGIQTLTPFAVVADLLIDLKIINSELGRLTLASTLLSDIISAGVTTVVRLLLIDLEGLERVQSLFATAVFLIAALFIIRPLSLWIIKQTPEGKPVKGAYVVLLSLTVLISAVMSDTLGLQYQFGPFIVGLFVPSEPPLGSTLVERLETLISGLFAPLIVSSCGLKFDLLQIYDLEFLGSVWAIFALSCALKLISVVLPSLLSGMPIRDATVISIIMSTQGIVELALYQNYFTNQTIDEETFASATISVLLMDITATVLVRSFYDYSKKYTGYQNRDIQHLAYNAEFRILACTHRQDDALAAIRLLDMSNATGESPIGVYALHLVELIGQASPLLINHDLGQKSSSAGFRSAKVIDVFRFHGEQSQGLISVQVFTAKSLPKFMQEDICSLAFDKLVSLVILPFHRKWNQQGKIVLDSGVIRTINRHVLELAPCSVGILIDRHKIRRSSHGSAVYRVAVVFIGGGDDREALAYGLRMAKSPGIHLSVIRLMSRNDMEEDEWETILNTESLKEIRHQSSHHNNMVYKEEMMNDESDTALISHQLAEAFDFIIVGRRHREDSPLLSGLLEFCELPELGPLGDLLASTDVKSPVSVLVVQQQLNIAIHKQQN